MGSAKGNKNIITVKINNHSTKMKEDTGADAIEEVANKLSDAAMFITLDACSGFWQLPMDEDSSKPLTFNTHWGGDRFTRLPFGVAPAPETYQREMERLFEGVPVDIIVDDLLINGKDEQKMNEKLRLVLERILSSWIEVQASYTEAKSR